MPVKSFGRKTGHGTGYRIVFLRDLVLDDHMENRMNPDVRQRDALRL